MRLKSITYYFREAFQDMKHNRGMLLASVGITLVMFIILGFSLLLTTNLDYMAKDVESKLQITAFLKDGLDEARIAGIEEELLRLDGVKSIYFVSNQEALKRLGQRLGNRKDLLAGYENDNPLRHSFEIFVQNVESVAVTAQKVERISGVAEARYGREEVEKLIRTTTALRIGMVFLTLGLSAATLFVLMNTIRLTVYARREEIQIMKYVGASDWFIRWPFLLQGIILGLLGALVAGAILFFIYLKIYGYVAQEIPFLPVLPVNPYLYNLIRLLSILGVLIGALGSVASLGKYLKV